MMPNETREIERSEWLPFFDSISSSLKGKAADITVSTPNEYVHQSRSWQLHGLTYDPHDHALIVSCRQQEHVIAAPTAIRVEKQGNIIQSVEVTKSVGEKEIIRFIDPLLLPAA
jgi:hypothetical protein